MAKNTQNNVRINVDFISNTANLTKDLQKSFNTAALDFGNTLQKSMEMSLNKSFKNTLSLMSDLTQSLSAPGLKPAQYEAIFNRINAKISESSRFMKTFKDDMVDVFDRKSNQDAIKDINNYAKALEKVKDLAIEIRKNNTRANTLIKGNGKKRIGIEQTLGIDFMSSTKAIEKIANQYKSKTPYSKGSLDWMLGNKMATQDKDGNINVQTDKIKKLVSVYDRWSEILTTLNTQLSEVNGLLGTKGTDIDDIITTAEGKLEELQSSPFTENKLKTNIKAIEKMDDEIEKTTDSIRELHNGFNQAEEEYIQMQEKIAAGEATLRSIAGQFGFNFDIGRVIRWFVDLGKTAFNFYKSLDSALNEIYVVSNLTDSAVNDLTGDFINMAKKTGMSIDDVTRSAVLFYQQGLRTDEVLTMTKVTSEFAKVAGITASDAADKLTAAVNGYCLAADDASFVADKFNKVAAASAADINELSTAFEKAAAQANQAGVSMDNYLAYIATMVEATREAPENIGTSLKTIFSRMQQIKTGDNTEDTTDVNDVETALSSVGIALRDTTGQLRDLEEIFDELGPKWNSLDRNAQAYLGTIIAGTRQQSRFITLMQNWDRVLDLADQSANSEGMQALMHEKAMDSITSKLEVAKVALQEFVSSLANSNFIKLALDLFTKLFNLMNNGYKPITLITSAVSVLGSKLYSLLDPVYGITDKFKMIKNLFVDLFKGNFSFKDIFKGNKNYDELIGNIDDKLAKLRDPDVPIKEELLDLEEINRLEKERERLIEERNNAQIRGLKITKEQALAITEASGMALKGISLLVNDKNQSGLLGGLGNVLTGIGKIETDPVGAIISGISGAAQVVHTIINWEDNLESTMTQAISKVSTFVEKATNIQTSLKSTKNLLKTYDELSKKVYLTTAEQEALNDAIQQLGDAYDIDVITDAFGNLSINIGEVNDKVNELAKDYKTAMRKLSKEEMNAVRESLGGIFNNISAEEYYNEFFASNGTAIKGAITGISDDLEDSERAISDTLSRAFNSSIKNNIYKEIRNNSIHYIKDGVVQGAMDIEEELNSIWTDSDGATKKSVLNQLYNEIDYLQTNINSFSFDEVQNHMDIFYERWGKANNVTLEQWQLIKDAMNDTLYGNSDLLRFNKQTDTMLSKADGSYYKNREKQLKEDLAKAEEANRTREEVKNAIVALGLTTSAFGNPAVGLGMTAGAYIAAWTDTEYKKNKNAIKQAKEALKENKKEQQEYKKELMKQYGFGDEKTLYSFLDNMEKIQDKINTVSTDTATFLASIPGLTSVDDLQSPELMDKWQEFITGAADQLEGLDDTEKVERFLELLAGSDMALEDGLRDKVQKMIDGAMSKLQQPTGFTFTQLGDELKSISEDLITINTIMEEFAENGSISLDTYMDLAKILDNIDLNNLGAISNEDVNYVDQYIAALHNLKLGYDEATGQITMNADALESLQTIQEAYTKSKLTQTRNELAASAAKVKTELAYIDAQIYATEDMIRAIDESGDEQLKIADLQNQATSTVNATFEAATANILEGYKTQTLGMNNYVTATLKGLSAVADAWGAVYKAQAGVAPEDMANRITEILKNVQETSSNVKWEGADFLNLDKYGKALDSLAEKNQAKGELEAYLQSLHNMRNRYAKYLEMYDTEMGLIDDMLGKDLSKLGTKDDKSKTLDKYIGQLLEIYNILNRIQNLQHRLSTLESYGETLPGEQYGNYLQQRLAYTKELVDQYSFLTKEQKKHTNAYQDFIQTVDGLQGVFDFDKYGQIIVNWEKYNNLQNQSINGETTLKEKADDVYNTYTQMYKDLQGYQDSSIDYYKQVVKLQQEMIDNYINLEKQAANAIKEIYKKILDDRLEAIDKEMQALDDLRKERQRAVKDAENAKVLSGYQTDLQRALMDTSGSSASAALKAQQNIEDKLSQMAEDKYSQMLDDIKDELNDVKEELQNEFDELFEKQDWLYTMLDNDIMGDQSKLYEILQQTSDWNTMSHVERMERLDEWDRLFSSYADNAIYGQKGIFGIYDELQNTKNTITALDTNLQGSVRQASNEIRQTIEKWENSVTQAMNKIASKVASSGGSGSPGNGANNSYNDGYKANKVTGDYDGTYTVADAKYYKIPVNSDVQYGAFSTKDDNGVYYQPDNIGGKKLKSTGAKGRDIGATYNSGGVSIGDHTVWIGADGKFYMWDGAKGKYDLAYKFVHACPPSGADCSTPESLLAELKKRGFKYKYARGGFANFTGPAWLDGSPSRPEAVLNALQTEHFIKFTNALDQIMSGVNGGMSGGNTGTVNIENISFNVESMSSKEDGEKAFNAFVNKFKEIGSQKGLTMFNYKSTL